MANKPIVNVIKIGGNIIDDSEKLHDFLKEFAGIKGKKILVHGGGKLATRLADELNIPQQMIEGRRITDQETLKVVTMVYAGQINKNIVATLQSENCAAIGLCGADGNLLLAKRRSKGAIDYGFVGDITAVNSPLIISLLDANLALVIAPLSHDGNGQILNTNADTIAQEIATSLSEHFTVNLIYSFEKAGVMKDLEDEQSLIPEINRTRYEELKSQNIIFAGMIPKLDNAFVAIDKGVEQVIIGKAEKLALLINRQTGTAIIA